MNPIVLQFFKKHSRIDREPCKFEATGWRRKTDKASVVVCSHRGCRRHAFTRYEPERVHAHCHHPRFMFGNIVGNVIKFFTLGTVVPKPGCDCNARRRLLNVMFGFNLPNWFVALLEITGRHKTQVLPWENPLVLPRIEQGPPILVKMPPMGTKATKVG